MFVYLNNHDYLNNQALFYNLPSPLVNSSWQVVEEYNKQLDKLMPFYDIKLESPIRCFSWSPMSVWKNVVSIGLDNGKVLITEVDGQNCKPSNNIVVDKQFYPEYVKSCTCMEWNRENSNWLAVGFNKPPTNKKLPSLVIWDVNFAKTPYLNDAKRFKVASKPLFKLSKEPVDSLAWLTSHGLTNILMAGHNSSYIKIYDVRVEKAICSTKPSKQTFGICCDPTCDTRVASYDKSGDIIRVWDTRNFPRPVLQIDYQPNISKIEWSASECGNLLVHSRPAAGFSSFTTHLYDVVREVKLYNGEPHQSCCNFNKSTLSTNLLYNTEKTGEVVETVAWYPQTPHLVLVASNKISFKMSRFSNEKQVTACSPTSSNYVVASNNKIQIFDSNLTTKNSNSSLVRLVLGSEVGLETIKKRSKNGYGTIKGELLKNIELYDDDDNVEIRLLWRWLHFTEQLYKVVNRPPNLFASPALQQTAATATTRCRLLRTRRHSSFQPSTKNTPFSKSSTLPSTLLTSASFSNVPLHKIAARNFRSGIVSLVSQEECFSEDDDRVNCISLNKENDKLKANLYQITNTRKLLLEIFGWRRVEDGDDDDDEYDVTADSYDVANKPQVDLKYLQKFSTDRHNDQERLFAIAVWTFDLEYASELLQKRLSQGDSSNASAWLISVLDSFKAHSNPCDYHEDMLQQFQSLKTKLGLYMVAALEFLFSYFHNEECKREAVASDVIELSFLLPQENRLQRYASILFNKEIYLCDRIGFACLHLSFDVLKTYLQRLENDQQNATSSSLQHIMLYGITSQTKHLPTSCLRILQNYIDKTSDLQTALSILLHTDYVDLLNNRKALYWKERYYSLLNSWKFYFERMDFEKRWNESIARVKKELRTRLFANNTNSNPVATSTLKMVSTSSINVACHYCNKNITHAKLKNRSEYKDDDSCGKYLDKISSIGGCPNCNQPLLKCSVCSLTMGIRPNNPDVRDWMLICVRCHHVGHYQHMIDWFKKKNRFCPVSDCECECENV